MTRQIAGPILLLLVGCTGFGGAELLEVTPWQPPPGQPCAVNKTIRPLAELLDSAAAVAAVHRIAPEDGGLLLSVRASEDDGSRDRFRIQSTIDEDDAAAIEAALGPTYHTSDARGRLLIEVTEGRVARLALGPSQRCAPVLLNEWELGRLLTVVHRKHRREGTANIWMFLDTLGQVVEAELRRTSGDVPLDLALLRTARQARFRPALLDHRPVSVWLAMDFTSR